MGRYFLTLLSSSCTAIEPSASISPAKYGPRKLDVFGSRLTVSVLTVLNCLEFLTL